MPHGITTDKDNNYWVTDVALHQVRVFSELVCLCPIFKPACFIVAILICRYFKTVIGFGSTIYLLSMILKS